jgi:hypothetical protein
MENFLLNHFGYGIFFVNTMAAEINNREANLELMLNLIKKEGIDELFIVIDTSCRFIANVLKNQTNEQTSEEKILKKILNNHYGFITENKSLVEQQESLALLSVRQQAIELMMSGIFQNCISHKVKLSGLITTKSKNYIIQLNFNH